MAYKNARSKAATKYNAVSTVGFTVRLNAKTDADIIIALESVENKNALIKKLLRAAITPNKTVNIDNMIKLYEEKTAFYEKQAVKYKSQAYETTARELFFVVELLKNLKVSEVN